jgi:hypothetical protein
MTKLDQIAANMRHTITFTKARYVHQRLARGLELVLERRERGYRLALGRTDTPPSDLEVEICAAAFNVPASTEPVRLPKIRQGKTGPVTYHVVELTWLEQEQPA